MKFKLGCQLDYNVVTPTTLFLNIEAQRLLLLYMKGNSKGLS
jgi:hypothetical protein